MSFTFCSIRHLFPLLDGFSDHDLSRLRARSCEKRFQPEEVLMRAQSCSGVVLFLMEGRVKIIADGDDGVPTVVAFCNAGQVLGEINAYTGEGHSASVVAETACVAWCFSIENFLDCVATMPALNRNLLKIMAQRLSRMTKQVHVLATQHADTRIVFNLLAVADEELKAIQRRADETVVSKPPPQIIPTSATVPISIQDLASMSGCTREQTHRVLDAMKNEGIIERTHGKIRILDRDALKHFGKNREGGVNAENRLEELQNSL